MNVYLGGCITSKPSARHRNKNTSQCNVYEYSYNQQKVYKSLKKIFWCYVVPIQRDRPRKKVLNFAVEDYREKYTNRKNKITNFQKSICISSKLFFTFTPAFRYILLSHSPMFDFVLMISGSEMLSPPATKLLLNILIFVEIEECPCFPLVSRKT